MVIALVSTPDRSISVQLLKSLNSALTLCVKRTPSAAVTFVTLDGVTYFCDPEMEGVFSRKREYGWDLFMKQYGDEGPTDYNIEKVF